MITIPNGIAINPYYITDEVGKKLSVILPVSEFDALMKVLLRSVETEEFLLKMPKKNKSARFKGFISSEEADDFDKYLKQTRSEWDRDI